MNNFKIYVLKEETNSKIIISHIKKHPEYIRNFKNPNENIQLISVKTDPTTIRFIKNPTKKVQLFVVNNRGDLIKYIKNPISFVRKAAIIQDPYAIRRIKNSTEKEQIIAVDHDEAYWDIYYFIKNPTLIVQLKIILKLFDAFFYKKNEKPTEKEVRNIFDKFPSKDNEKFQNKLIKFYPGSIIRFFNIVSFNTQEKIIKQDAQTMINYPNFFSSEIKEKYHYLMIPGKLGIFKDKD